MGCLRKRALAARKLFQVLSQFYQVCLRIVMLPSSQKPPKVCVGKMQTPATRKVCLAKIRASSGMGEDWVGEGEGWQISGGNQNLEMLTAEHLWIFEMILPCYKIRRPTESSRRLSRLTVLLSSIFYILICAVYMLQSPRLLSHRVTSDFVDVDIWSWNKKPQIFQVLSVENNERWKWKQK